MNHELIEDYFKDAANLSFMIQGVESKRFDVDSIDICKDVMFNQETGKYEFIVYGGKYIPEEDDWGLYDYYFVIQLEIDLKKVERKDQILKARIIKDEEVSELKIWWRKYMRSYSESKYAKKAIADKYGLVPPPPPPPETKEWF